MAEKPKPIHGFLNIDKPKGITSHDVVARVRRLARQKRVGHAGTLDPAATGVLVVALGLATRLIEYVQDDTLKRYHAVVQLGTTTTTDDTEGTVVETQPIPPLDTPTLETTLAQFRGTIRQVPPQFSALHHQGRRLYELAREGTVVEIPARTVVIEELQLLAWAEPFVTLDVLCHKGTYIRSLARDLGQALGCGGHLYTLRRTAVGAFDINQAVSLEELERPEQPTTLADVLIPPSVAVANWPKVTLDSTNEKRVRNGQKLILPDLTDDRVSAHTTSGELVAILLREGDTWKPEKVFNWTSSN
ncbi:MAG: tRNA pseudouridine(55) synthase TruB [Chloroflexota bacterium]